MEPVWNKKVIILAAGRGIRMMPLTEKLPKALLPINDSTILERLVRQLLKLGIEDITVVVGFMGETVISVIGAINDSIKFIINNRYNEDINILSLTLALREDLRPFYLFEADCNVDDFHGGGAIVH